MIDTHCHLDAEQFATELDAVLDRARAAGVQSIVAVGTTLESSRRAVDLARQYRIVRASVGIHPNYAADCPRDDWRLVAGLAALPEVVAIGETGLDRFRNDTPFEQQLDCFRLHAAISREYKKPLVIHCREAEADVLACLEEAARAGPVQGVMHSFTGSAATAARCVELGLYVSFAGQLTYTNRKFDALREVARCVPADRLLVETDSPYLAPEPHRGERNEPSFVRLTAQRLAELRKITPAELARLTTENARRLFALEIGP